MSFMKHLLRMGQFPHKTLQNFKTSQPIYIIKYLKNIKNKILSYEYSPDTIAMIPGIITSIGLVIYCYI